LSATIGANTYFGHDLGIDGIGFVFDMNDLGDLADRELRQWPALRWRDITASGRNRITVRVEPRVAHAGCKLLGLSLRKGVLAKLGLLMPSLGLETGLVREVALPKPVGPHHSKRIASAFGCQGVAGVCRSY
jgi:hypothetical protein